METSNPLNDLIEHVFVTGINFKNANVNIRSSFSFNSDQILKCLKIAGKYKFSSFIVLSTCNRTEIYGIGSIAIAEKIILEVSNQAPEDYNRFKFSKHSHEAIEHLFYVASGIYSQILGDNEILGQFRNACKISKSNSLLGPEFERLANVCIQSSKEIKTKTALSKGTVSATYAAVEVIKEQINIQNFNVLLIGAGKLGHNIAKNIKHYFPSAQLTIANRTKLKAKELALEINSQNIEFESVTEQAKLYEVIIICAVTPLFKAEHFINSSTKLVLDMTVPQSVHPEFKIKNQITVLDIDDISAILEKSIDQRKTYLPLAEDIIRHHIAQFLDWYQLYKQREYILVLKEMLSKESMSCPFLSSLDDNTRDKKISKAIQEFVLHLKENPDSTVDLNQSIAKFKALNHQSDSKN